MNSKELGKVGQVSRGISLTWKITIGLTSIIMLLGLFIAGVVYQLTSTALQDEFNQRAIAIAANLSDAAAAHLVTKDVSELSGLLTSYARLQGVEYAFITDGQGAVIAHTLGTFPPELRETVSTGGQRHAQRRALRFRGKTVHETSFPIFGGRAGAAHVGMRRDFIEGEMRHALIPMIGIISAIFVGGIALSSLFVWVITRPIRHLSHVADAMSKGDLDTPVGVRVKSHDEIGDLARSLERMRASLKAAMSRLSSWQPPPRSDEVASYQKYLSAEMIDDVARDLKLTGQPHVKTEAATTNYELPEDLEGVSQLQQAKTHVVDDRRRSGFEPTRAGMYAWPRSRSFFARIGIGVLGIAALAGAGIVLYSQENGPLAALVVNFKNLAGIGNDLVGLHRQNLEPARPELTTEKVFNELPSYKSPDPQVPTTKNKEIPPTPTKTITRDRPLSAPDDVTATAEQLESKIYKAIDNRAIRGVEVSVREGTVSLTGRVASENQKIAAAQAARSVPGVKEVLDQIIVDSFTPENNGESG